MNGITMTEQRSEHTTYTLDELREMFEHTEGIEEYPFEYGPDMGISVSTEGKLSIDGAEYRLARDAMEQLCKQLKVNTSHLDIAPDIFVPFMNALLNYYEGSLKALIKNDVIVSFCRVGTQIVSSEEILDSMLQRLKDGYGLENPVVVNPYHDLFTTQYTLVFPQKPEMLESGDVLLTGIHVQNSLIGLEPLVVHNVVGRDYHFNVMLSEDHMEKWDRRQSKAATIEEAADGEEGFDVYQWASDAVVEVHKDSRNDIVSVARLAGVDVGSHSGTLLQDVLSKHSVPNKVANLVREAYADQPGQTVYDLWSAVTETVNHDELVDDVKNIRKLMKVGGALAAHPNSCPSCHRLTEEL